MYKPGEKLMMDGRGEKESGWRRGSGMAGGCQSLPVLCALVICEGERECGEYSGQINMRVAGG